MKTRLLITVFSCILALSGCSEKFYDWDKHKAEEAANSQTAVRLTLIPQGELVQGKPITVLAKLNSIADRTVITPNDLETVHTQKFHLLVIDPSFTDYQHIHPQPTATPGLYSFTFTPKMAGGYRAWADVTPKETGQQEFAMADLGAHRGFSGSKIESHEATVGNYHFALSFDKTPTQFDESMGSIKITDASGNPVASLEPVMGAFAHIVGFYDDFHSIVHTHPMGKEPSSDSELGGPELMFHLVPNKAGFIKLFAQVKIGGKEYFVPFGVTVAKAP